MSAVWHFAARAAAAAGRRGELRHSVVSAAASVDRAHAREADLASALRRLHELIHPGSLVLLLSDLQQPPSRWQAHLTALARHNEIAAITLYDPLEAELPPGRTLPLTDGERVLEVDSGDAGLRRRYRKAFTTRQKRVVDLLRRHRGTLFSVGTQEDPAAALRGRLRSLDGGR